MLKLKSLVIVLTIIPFINANATEIPKGKVEEFIYNDSKIFPGTEREVFVYIPQQLNKTKTACVYVQQDGLKRKNFPQILDTLIAKEEIPLLVGVFISPGKLPPPTNNPTLVRDNRSFEYDGLGDNYARFVLEEILPFIENKFGLNLSKDGNDRAIGGASSGGIAAFNAAWEHPEAFSRVYCNSGSFVAFRGGHEFPILVRKTEPKPIRAYLTTGTNDMENAAGDWTLIDLQMEKALKFSGYDYHFEMLEGKHVVGYESLFTDAMRFLWKGWPEPVKQGAGAPRVQDIIVQGETWEILSTEHKNSIGSACNPQGEIFFLGSQGTIIYKIDLNGQISEFAKSTESLSDLTFDKSGKMFAISEKGGKIIAIDENGKTSNYAEGINGQNILLVSGEGFYVSGGEGSKNPGVWYVGKETTRVDSILKNATGMAISPDKWLLAVADKYSNRVYSFEIAEDGTLKNKEPYYWLHTHDKDYFSEPTSVCFDRQGRLYVATNYGIQACAENGPVQVILPLPKKEKIHDICFGGEGQNILYVFCENVIYKRKLKAQGITASTPWMKMTKRKL